MISLHLASISSPFLCLFTLSISISLLFLTLSNFLSVFTPPPSLFLSFHYLFPSLYLSPSSISLSISLFLCLPTLSISLSFIFLYLPLSPSFPLSNSLFSHLFGSSDTQFCGSISVCGASRHSSMVSTAACYW